MLALRVLFLCLFAIPAAAEQIASLHDRPQPIRISIVIDDVGDNWKAANRLLNLPGPIAFAILPGTPFADRVAKKAAEKNKTVMLHLPMHTHDHRDLGPLGLTMDMNEDQVKRLVRQNIDAIPFVQGVNNHMGSLLTRHPGHMQWVMDVIADYDNLFFIDSRTSVHTVALNVAQENGIPSTKRDVFLDPDMAKDTVEKQWKWLLTLAKRQGYAVAIGHPYPHTLDLLEREIPKLAASSRYRFVAVNTLANAQPIDPNDGIQQASIYP